MKSDVQARGRVGRQLRQKRSRITYEALIAAGFRLLENSEFESVTIAELAQDAGYSVGAFYSRFHSKDEFFEAMIAHHLEERSMRRAELLENTPNNEWIDVLIADLVRYYWRRRRFWRAALIRSTHDPEFWKPIGAQAEFSFDAVTARIRKDARRPLTESERKNVRFAFQLVLAAVNNRIVNRPQPSAVGQAAFVKNLIRAFRLVSAYDELVPKK